MGIFDSRWIDYVFDRPFSLPIDFLPGDSFLEITFSVLIVGWSEKAVSLQQSKVSALGAWCSEGDCTFSNVNRVQGANTLNHRFLVSLKSQSPSPGPSLFETPASPFISISLACFALPQFQSLQIRVLGETFHSAFHASLPSYSPGRHTGLEHGFPDRILVESPIQYREARVTYQLKMDQQVHKAKRVFD